MRTPFAPFTGFGDDINTSVKFTINQPGDRLPQWVSPAILSAHRIANSNRTVRQRHGRGAWTWVAELSFGSAEEFDKLDAMVGYSATLRYIEGITNRAGGHHETIVSTRYLTLPDTTLLSLSGEADEVNGEYVARAMFERQYEGGT